MKDSYTLKSLAVLLENNKISSKELTAEYLKNIDHFTKNKKKDNLKKHCQILTLLN